MSDKKTSINWYPGHMAKTKREIKEKLDLIDVVFEVIDARIPYSSKNKDINEMIKNKPRILIMTKLDLCDCDVSSKWKSYYEELGYKVIMLDLLNNGKLNEIYNETDKLLSALNNKRKEKGLRERKLRVLILGIPNVGKSTLINRLVGKKVANVGNKPGVTKNLDWIRINNDLELVRGREAVHDRLLNLYKPSKANRLYSFYCALQLNGESVVRDSFSKYIFYRNRKDLIEAKIDFSQSYKVIESDIYFFNPFTSIEVA